MLVENALIVAAQVLVLLIYMLIGLSLVKIKWLDDHGIYQMTQLLLFIISPCVIVNTFQMEFSFNLLKNLGIAGLSAVFTHLSAIIISKFLFRRYGDSERKIFKYGMVFSNCGFMSIPLLLAVLGPIGVFYGSAYIAVFNITQWTYGVLLMTGDQKDINLRRAFINPGTVGLSIGLFFFLGRISLPAIPGTVVASLANINTPIAMIIIGAQMAKNDLIAIWKNTFNYVVGLWKLIIIPILTLVFLNLLPIERDLLIACMIPASASSAASTALFATRYGQNVRLATQIVTTSTILSVITMPLLIVLANWLWT